MSQTLYRKYRPQAFKELVDQNHIRITLMNELESGRIAHAYLFTGPRGVGKTTMARLFAKSLNCKNRKKESAEPCNACNSCKDIVKGRLLDLIEIDAASHTGVDNVR
ncbi:AAA family ATPase, partial [Patescibacteria group bacterium]|nr:AAA family ATPase [Patescibacteria group bacterium]